MKILIIDDHVLFREGLISLVAHQPDMSVVGEGGTVREAIELSRTLQPNMILMDFSLPDGTGLDAAEIILKEQPDMRIIFLTIHDDDDLFQVAQDLTRFEPCGEGNRQPLLLARGKVIKAREVRGGHLQLEIQTSKGEKLRAFGFGLGSKADGLANQLGIVGTLRISRYQSVERAEMRIERLAADESVLDTSRQNAKS